VYGVEADANARRVADKYGFKVHIGLFEAQDFKPNMFDYVTLSQVLEHVVDPIKTLRDVSTVLKEGGFAIISMPNANGWGAKVFGRRWINWHIPYHLQFFSDNSMSKAAKQAGLELVRNSTVTSSNWIVHQLVHLIEYPAQGNSSAYWAGKGRSSGIVNKMIRKTISASRLFLVPQLLTRFMDLLGRGDNRVLILKKLSNEQS
jgi:SAM-dependent methyltransferase